MSQLIFISYSSKDREKAREIRDFLTSVGASWWMAPDSISLGGAYFEAIPKGIRDSQLVLLLLSPNSDKSRHVSDEMAMACNCDKRIVPIRIEEFEPTRLKFFVLTRQWFDFFGADRAVGELRLRQLVAELRESVSKDGKSSNDESAPDSSHELESVSPNAIPNPVELKPAACVDEAKAHYKLAIPNADSADPEPDPKAEFERFRAAADQGDPESALRLAEAYHEGKGVPRNEPESARWFRCAAEGGLASAQLAWALILLEGRVVRKDPVKASEWLEQAAKQGNAVAEFRLAQLRLGGLGIPQNEAAALAGFRRAAGAGYAAAQFHLAWMLFEGRGCASNKTEALRWANEAARQGYETAAQLIQKLPRQA